MAGTLVRDVRATLDIEVAKAQQGLRDLERSGAAAERSLKGQEDAARGYERQLEKTGTAANTMRRRLEAATRALPKITINADSSDADSKIVNLRESLDGLASQKIGIDVSGTDALSEMRRIKDGLEELARTEADPIVRADVQIALREINRVEAELSKLEQDTTVHVDVDTKNGLAQVEEIAHKAGTLGSLFSEGFGVIGKAGPANVAIAVAAIELLPTIASAAAAGIVFSVGSALATVGITAAAQSDVVRHAWLELGADLKRELGDVAEPLEGSALRAAEVARTAFERLKPSLARIFSDLVPDIDHFVEMAGRGVGSLGPVLEKLGGSFGNMLSSLGDRMPQILDNIGDSLETVSAMLDDDPQMLANLVEDASELLKVGAEVLAWADDIKAVVTLPFDASNAGNKLFEATFGATPEEMYRDMGAMDKALGEAQSALVNAASAAQQVGASAGEAGGGVRNLSDALENMYDPAAKALDAEIRLKEAIQEADRAAKDQKMTEIERLKAVQDTTSAIADAAKSESERTGKTTEAGKAFLDQLPHLQEWAGKNSTAQVAISALGDSLGITTIKTKDGTFAIDALGKAIKILPNGKKVEIDANTAKGKAQLAELMLQIARQKGTIDVHVRTIYDSPSGRKAIEQKNRAAGGIERYATGGVRGMAAGGRMSPPPHIANSPTILYGEGSGDEAFIPYDEQYRQRAIKILGKVADDFGLEVYNPAAKEKVTTLVAGLTSTDDSITTSLDAATRELDVTLGNAGALTQAVGNVGTLGGQVAQSWVTGSTTIGTSVTEGSRIVSVSVTGMSEAVTTSSDKVVKAALKVFEAINKASASSNKGASQGSVIPPAPGSNRGGSQGSVIPPAPGSNRGGSEGSVIPPAPPKPQVITVGADQVASLPGVSVSASSLVNASTLRSVPVSASTAAGGQQSTSSSGGSLVSIGSFHATPEQSPHAIAEDLAWLSRSGG